MFNTLLQAAHTALQNGSLDNSDSYLHNGTELCFVLHLLLRYSSLDTGQNTRLEEVPPIMVEDPEKQLEQLCFHIRR